MNFIAMVLASSLLLTSVFTHHPASQPAFTPLAKTHKQAEIKTSLNILAANLDEALLQLEQAPSTEAAIASVSQIRTIWDDFSQSVILAGEGLAAQSRVLVAQQGSDQAAARLEAQRSLTAQMTVLEGHYQTLGQATSDLAELRRTAHTMRATLAGDTPDTLALNLDRLPVRPAPAHITPPEAQATPAQALAEAPWVTGPPTPEDLASNEDARMTPEIVAQARALGYDPVAIFNFVRNKIGFDPYYGSRKGALLTLWQRSGNDVDTASLLVALLRASGYPARYIKGFAEFDGATARNWVGNAPDLTTAKSIFATSGVSVSLPANGNLVKEHVWVEVYDQRQFKRADVFLPLVSRNTASNLLAQQAVEIRSDPDVRIGPIITATQNGAWVALDASFKQFTYTQPLDLKAVTGFSVTQVIAQARATAGVSDALKSLSLLPTQPSIDQPNNSDADLELADVLNAQAVSKTLAYAAAHPTMTSADFLGGAFIVSKTLSSLTATLPFTGVASPATTEYSTLPASLRDRITVRVDTTANTPIISYTASFAALANQRVIVSYIAARPSDQATIDASGGSLLTTQPGVRLYPVLKLNGVEVARGAISTTLGSYQLRRMDFTTASGYSDTVSNYLVAGETYAVGIAYGRTSQAELAASQSRLQAARSVLPKDAQGNPNPSAPGNMSEAVVGEMLNQALLAYWNQNDIYAELVARAKGLRWYRFLSAGVAMQDLVISRIFNIPLSNDGGGFGFDIQENILGVHSLRNQPDDVRTWFKTAGMFGSATEHSAFENIGQGAVSTMRLLSTALERGIPVHRIDASNKATVLPLLRLNSSVESEISRAVNQGQVVIVPEADVKINDWSGVGWIVMNPNSGAAGYLISGGLAGVMRTAAGGSLWNVLKTVAAYAWLAINMGLDLWGIWAGIALLLVPEPTLLTKVAGLALIAANLAALGFDIADLNGLLSGDLSAQQYIGEQITGLIIQAILKRLGIAVAGKIIESIGSGALSKVVREIDKITEGAASRLLNRGFVEADVIRMTERGLVSREAFQTMDDLAKKFGPDEARALLNNDYIANKQAIERVARAALNAPDAPGLDKTIQNALKRGDFGYAYELERAAANAGNVAEYGKRIDVSFNRITGFDANGKPIFDVAKTVQPLEGDIVLKNGTFIDAKHGPVGNDDLRIWNQIVKAQEAISNGQIPAFQFEASSSVGKAMRDWAAINAPDVKFIINLADGFPLDAVEMDILIQNLLEEALP